MNWRQRVFLFSVLLPFAGLALNPAHAQTRVGEAVLVQNQVARVAGSLTMPISVGDGLMRDETVRTGTESAAKLLQIAGVWDDYKQANGKVAASKPKVKVKAKAVKEAPAAAAPPAAPPAEAAPAAEAPAAEAEAEPEAPAEEAVEA